MPEEQVLLALARVADTRASAPAFLDAAERQRFESMRSASRRDEFAVGRMLAKHLLEFATGRPAASHAIRVAQSGKPESASGLGLSIAHSAGFVACAVAHEATVGVDIERPSPTRRTQRISRAHFTDEEVEWLDGEPPDSFYRLWVLKEAWLKARGTGLAGGLDRLSCTLEGPRINARVDGEDARALFLFEWQGTPVGLATDGPGGAPAVLEWSAGQATLAPLDLRPACRTDAA